MGEKVGELTREGWGEVKEYVRDFKRGFEQE